MSALHRPLLPQPPGYLLPARIYPVNLTSITGLNPAFPLFLTSGTSESGRYALAISQDRNDRGLVTRNSSIAHQPLDIQKTVKTWDDIRIAFVVGTESSGMTHHDLTFGMQRHKQLSDRAAVYLAGRDGVDDVVIQRCISMVIRPR